MKVFNIDTVIDRKFIVKMTRISLLCLSFFLFALNCMAINSYSQSVRLSMKIDNPNLKDAIVEIKKQTEFDFLYSKDIESLYQANAKIEIKEGTIEEVLNQMFKNSRINYQIIDKTIVLTAGKPVSENTNATSAVKTAQQGITITGTVTDNNAPLPGVTVLLKGTTIGVATDINGKYSINVPNEEAVLHFSFVGYITTELVVGNQRIINVELKEEAQQIEEVVVIGYGVARKSDVTGSVARADLTATENAPNTNIAQAIKGAVPGLNIGIGTNNRAGNNDDISITVRGRNTISGARGPLLVVDGMIYRGNINDLNPSDIQSIDVLKDASSTAIYGSQAANGVLMITTKMVRDIQKPIIEYNGNFALQNLINSKWKGVDREGYIWQIESHHVEERRLAPDYLQPNPNWDITKYFRLASQHKGWLEGTDTDWWGMGTIKTPYITNHSLSIRGRADRVNYFLSFGLMDQKNLVINDKWRRYSFRTNLETKVTNWFTTGMQAFFNISDTSGQSPDMGSITSEIPIMAAYDDNGKIIRRPDRGSINILVIPDNKDLNQRFGLRANFYADIKIPFIEGLSYRVTYAPGASWSRAYRFDYTAQADQGEGYKNYTNGFNWQLDHVATYRRTFGQHSFNITAGYGVEKLVQDETNSRARVFTDQSLNYNSLGLGQSDQHVLSSNAWQETSLFSMGRIIYSFKDRYITTATIRRDGFSGFGANYKTAVFPSMAFAWRISEENFFKQSVPMFNDLKLRASWGKSGNRPPERYATMAQMGTYIPFRSNSGADEYLFGDGGKPELVQAVRTMSNPDLRWETTSMFNFGADFSLLKGRLSGSYEYYYSKTTDLIYNVRIPQMNGAFPRGTGDLYIELKSNIGQLQNYGHEFSLTGVPVMSNGFQWTLTGNISMNRDKILSIFGDRDVNNVDLINAGIFVGEPIDVNYDFEIIGMWQLEDHYAGRIPAGAYFGTYKIRDINGDGDLKPGDDRAILSYREPSYRFNIRSQLTYKGFEFNFIINSIQGGKKYYRGRPAGDGFGYLNMDYYPNVKHDWWMPENPNARYKRIGKEDARVSTVTPYVSRSFIRLQDLTLAYNLPSAVVNKVGISRAKVFINATNLFTFTDWDGWDPEPGNGQGLNAGLTYPTMKQYAIGVNFAF